MVGEPVLNASRTGSYLTFPSTLDRSRLGSFGTAATQHYYDITIYLSEADPNFKNTLGKGSGVVASDMVTSDGGKTWTISSITLPQYTA